MSSTPSNELRGSSAKGAARRTSAVQLRRRRRSAPIARRSPRSAAPARPADCAGRRSPRPGPPPSARWRPRGQQIAPVLGKDDPARDAPDRVAGAADALHARRDRRRRLDLDDQVDRAHVDAELERRGRDDRRQLAALQPLFDLAGASRARPSRGAPARSPRPRSRSCAPASRSARRRLLTKIIVERCARTSSTRRGWIDGQIEPAARPAPPRAGLAAFRRPRRAGPCPRPGPRRSGRTPCGCPRPRSRPAAASTRRGAPAGDLAAAEEARDLLQRPLRRREADALERPAVRGRSASSALEREEQVRAALGRRDRVDLVDDDGLDRREASRAPARSGAGTATRAS